MTGAWGREAARQCRIGDDHVVYLMVLPYTGSLLIAANVT